MAKRALVIGSPTHGLRGVVTDVTCMEHILGIYGFTVDRRLESEATRAGILDGYEQLIRDSREGDAAVIYYSGHGGLATANGTRHRFLVPVDVDQSTENDFRGVLDVELSSLLHRLTTSTRNVTLLIDCCYSARLSRENEDGLFPRALTKSWKLGVAAHLESLRSLHLEGHVESNPHAVRLAAAGPSQEAYEGISSKSGHIVGLFTESLHETLLANHGVAVTWDAIGRQIRERVRVQRCEVEGPHTSALFGSCKVDHRGVLSFFVDRGRPSLRGGRLFSVEIGDAYTVESIDAEPIGATVTEVGAAVSRVELESGRSVDEIVDGALAFPSQEVLDRVHPFHELTSGHGANALETPWDVELGRVSSWGRMESLPPSGGGLTEGEALYVRLHNQGEETIYVSVFNLGVGDKVTLLTTSGASGIELFPHEEYVVGYRKQRGLVGLKLSWPEAVPRTHKRIDRLMAIASDRPLDTRTLESKGIEHLAHQASRPARGHESKLRYAIRRLDFHHHPLKVG